MPAASLRKLDTTSQSWPVLPQAIVVYVFGVLHSCQVGAVSLVSLSQTCCFYRRHTCATSALCDTQKGVLVVLLCSEGPLLAHRVALHM